MLLLAILLPFIFSKKLNSWLSPRDINKANIFQEIGIKIANLKKTNSSSEEEEIEESFETIFKPIEKPYRILIMGDSLVAVAGGFGDIIEQKLIKLDDIEVLRKGKVSSGMSRPDYFDWKKESKTLLESFNPNIAIVMMGTNDAQSFENQEREVLFYGTEEWDKEYKNRIIAFDKQLTNHNIRVFKIGLPQMKDTAYAEKIQHINKLNKEASEETEQVTFISGEELLDGYQAFMPDENGIMRATRLDDGIHLTYFGGSLLVDQVINELKNYLIL